MYSAAEPGQREKNAATRALWKSKCHGIPSKPAFLTEYEALPAQKPDRRESPPGDSADKMTRETCPGKSSNGKEKRPRSRREKVSVPGFFCPSPEKEIPSPEKRIPGLGISRSSPEISRRIAKKVKDTDKTLHKSPVLCKKIAQKSAIWVGLRKSRVTKIIQNGTICLFSQAFHDILIFGVVTTLLCAMRTAMKNCPASQGDEPRRGGGGLAPTGTTPDASADNINGSEKRENASGCIGSFKFANLDICGIHIFVKRVDC